MVGTSRAEQIEPACARRVIILGASNLARGMPTLLESVGLCCPGPREVFMACGRGRSYGMASRVMGRTLPGITQCGLWTALAERPPLESVALVTDIGNDILFGAPVATIAGWVETCLDRLLEHRSRTVVTALPLMNLEGLTPTRLRILQRLLFPRCRLSFTEMLARARELDAHVRRLAAERGMSVVEPQRLWYGFDPIHIRYRHAATAWREILAAWSDEAFAQAGAMSWLTWARLQRLKPAQRWIFGIEQRGAQPALRWPDGTTLWLY